MPQVVDLTGRTLGAYRCELGGCGGYTRVVKVDRSGLTVVRIRRCATCKATTTTHEKKIGMPRPAKV